MMVVSFATATRCVVAAGVCVISTLSLATPLLTWTDSTPSALAPFAGQVQPLAELAQRHMVMFQHAPQSVVIPHPDGAQRYDNVRFQTAALIVNTTPEQIKHTLSQYQQYVGLFPTLTHAKVLQKLQNIQQVKYSVHVPIPIPILSFKEDVVMQHQLDDHSLSTLIIESPIQYGQGKFEWYALPNKQTLVTLTQWGDLNTPKGFVISTIFKSMPEIKQGIPVGVNGFVLESLRQRFNKTPMEACETSKCTPQLTLPEDQWAWAQKYSEKIQAPVIFVHEPVGRRVGGKLDPIRFVSAVDTLDAPMQKVQPLMSDPHFFAKTMRQIRKIEVKPQANYTDATFHIGLGLGVISIPFRLDMRYEQDTPQSVRYRVIGGDIDFMQGRMAFAPAGHRTRIVMTTAGKVGDNDPFLLRIGRALPYSDFLSSLGSLPVLLGKADRYVRDQPKS
jgi:carbon monoxide dehydrogenase subunit G